MNTFSQLGVQSKNLTGVKIEIEKVLDKIITVFDFRVNGSKFSRDGMCLSIQIEYENDKRVIFTGSAVLLEDIEKIPKEGFPFTTTIVRIPFKEKQFFYKFT